MDLCFGTFFGSCFQHGFGLVLGAFWGSIRGSIWPFWVLKLLQVWSKTALATHFLTKSIVLKKQRKTNGFSRFLLSNMAPKTLQDRPKTPPRRSWRGTFSISKNVINFGSFWARFGVPFGVPFGTSWEHLGVTFGV